MIGSPLVVQPAMGMILRGYFRGLRLEIRAITRSALRSMLRSVAFDRLPLLASSEARAFAFAAWLLSGTGYERPGPAKSRAGSASRAPVVSLAMGRYPSGDWMSEGAKMATTRCSATPKQSCQRHATI